jgi:membrane-associated HD superfamily phosphohydrolase
LLPLSIIICLGTLSESAEELMFISYLSLFGLFYLAGNSPMFNDKLIRNNAFLVLGSVGTIIILLMLSFEWFLENLLEIKANLTNQIEFYIAIFISLSAAALLALQIKSRSWNSTWLMDYIFVLFILIFIIGLYNSFAPVILINLIIFILGLLIIKKGANRNHLGILNYGLSIITALVICRFFDTDISFVVRGLLFVIVGVGFFTANYLMIKKRKAHEK